MPKMLRAWSLGKLIFIINEITHLTLFSQTYECKKDRSYKVRPTRTQQLKKPIKLYQPELPKELQDKRGLADEILKRKEKERSKNKKRSRYKSKLIVNIKCLILLVDLIHRLLLRVDLHHLEAIVIVA